MDSKPSQSETEEDHIQMDTCLIDREITKSKAYEEEGVVCIVLYNPFADQALTPINANPNSKYLAHITKKFNYFGILSDTLTREIFGRNTYSNNDCYIGFWEKDKRDGIGIYTYRTNVPDLEEFYLGQWVKGKKQGKGIYIWKHSPSSETNLNKCPYNAIIGKFDKDAFVNGCSIKKCLNETDNKMSHIIYEGKISQDWKRSDKDAILIENNQVFFGEFENDDMKSGTLTTLKSPSEADTCFSFIKKDNDPNQIEFTENNSKSQSEQMAIDIMRKSNEIQFFQNIEKLYSDLSLLNSLFSDIQKLQIENFQNFFSNLMEYLKKDFTLKSPSV